MRSYVFFDTVRRYLEYKGYAVTLVQNFTDVDDRIIQQAQQDGVAPLALAERFIEEAKADAAALNICPADAYPRVTEEMDAIIVMVALLVEKGYAYAAEGHVFFDAQKAEGYGKLSKKNIDDLLAGVRPSRKRNSPNRSLNRKTFFTLLDALRNTYC
jgi:cysteinyl-tRNA synthetase